MSEATPSPDPRSAATPSDPTAPSAPAPWTPPDPLAAPQNWATPDPWSPMTPPPAPWPPATYPSTPRPGGGGRVAAIVTVVTVVVLGLCACFGVAGLLTTYGDRPVAEDPYGDPHYEEPDGEAEPTAESTRFPTPDRTQRPVTRPTSGPAPVTVVYEVTGTGRADISYFDAESDLIHVDGVQLPWRTTVRTNGTSRVMVEATWSDEADLPISCKVTVTGAGKPVIDAVDGVWRTTCAPE